MGGRSRAHARPGGTRSGPPSGTGPAAPVTHWGVTGDGRLNALEAGFLGMETDVQPLHVGSLLAFEGPAPDHRDLSERIAARLASVVWPRRRAQRMPLDLGRPIWVDSPRFSVAEHLHHAVLDPPGDDAQLRAMVLWIMAERLDVDRPMWEMWQVDGLSGGRWAVIAKAHHAMVDGRSGTRRGPVRPRPGTDGHGARPPTADCPSRAAPGPTPGEPSPCRARHGCCPFPSA